MKDSNCRIAHLCYPRFPLMAFFLFAAFPVVLTAQSPSSDIREDEPAAEKEGPPVNVQGVVRNVIDGEPIAHVLVRVESATPLGVLTDSQGRFEFARVPSGKITFTIKKPGFHDPATGGERDMERTVLVGDHTPELIFALRPVGQLEGQIVLSTGDQAASFNIELLRRMPNFGRLEWTRIRTIHTDDQGNYAFFDLEPGDYTLHTSARLENPTSVPDIVPSAARTIHRSGFPCVYYPGVPILPTAGQIRIGPGEHASADININLEPFYPVTFSALAPDGSPFAPNLDTPAAHKNGPMAVEILDIDNRLTGYFGRYDAETQTVQADLPDGQYSVRVYVNQEIAGKAAMGNSHAGYLLGIAPFTVAGHALHNLRLPLFPPLRRELVVRKPAASGDPQHHVGGVWRVWMSPAADALAGTEQEMEGERDENGEEGSFNLMYNPLSAQWLHARSGGSFCIDRIVASGTDPTHEPIVNNPVGPNPPIEIVLRLDCAQLTLALPPAAPEAAIRPNYSVWVVPEFPTLEEPERLSLSPSEESENDAHLLAPGRYRVYTLLSSADMPYRDADAMERIAGSGQSVTLAPSEHANLVLELPKGEAASHP
jgi:hypothetical protein